MDSSAIVSDWNNSISWGRRGQSRSDSVRGPIRVCTKVISRLKVISGMLDYGPKKSKDGCINFRKSTKPIAVFYLAENPNPHTTNEVTLVCKGTEPYTSER
jgi:hypothetical protein